MFVKLRYRSTHSCFLKDSSRVLSKPASELCHRSIKIFHDCKVKTFIQKGLRTKFSNYSSILLLHLISKIIGNIIYEQTHTFLSNNQNHSTGSCLTFLHDKNLKGINKGFVTGMILMDHQKVI